MNMKTEKPPVVVVTGASRGVGRGIAIGLGAHGCTVYVTGRSETQGSVAGTIHDTGTAWQCSNVGKCKFRMGKSLCQREIPREQVEKILTVGKTDLIPRFISKKGRPFSAYLKIEDGKVTFEFEPREKKAPATKKPIARKKTPSAAS